MPVTRAARRRRRRRPVLRAAFSLLAVLFAASAVAAAYAAIFCFRYYTVSSNSMSPTLMGNRERRDRVLCWMRSFPGRDPIRWEIDIFHTPNPQNLARVGSGEKLPPGRDMTIKRIIGLPGETLALRGGDVWTKTREDAPFKRRVKPRAVQDALWIPVYEASFPETRLEEFGRFWRARHGEARVGDARIGGDGLLPPAGAAFRFRPEVRTGRLGREARALPGIPDRYLLPQELSFVCPGCGASFSRWFAGGQVQERCPACDVTAYDEDVRVYSHDSGLTSVGEDAVTGIPAGNAGRERVYPYSVVGDLRVAVEARLSDAGSALSLGLEKNGAVDSVELSASGVALNGRVLSGVPGIAAEEWFSVEFSRVDGELRLVIEGGAAAAVSSSDETEEETEDGESSSGVSFEMVGGGAVIRKLSVGRDVHYFSGAGNPHMPQFSAMSAEGTVAIPNGAFFTLGDNTDVSLDGRSWGAIPISLLAGTAVWRDKGERMPREE